MTPETILLVEDERDIAFPLGRTLEREGYDVAWVDNGREAFDVVDDGPVAVVILDLSLPDMDGLDVCRALREDGYTGGIMMMTGRAGELDIVVGLDCGADDYLLKPFGLAELCLTNKEVGVLRVLSSQRGKVVPRSRIMSEVWDENWYGSTKTLDVTIGRLRAKLEEARLPDRIVAVRGVGFRLEQVADRE